MVAFEGLLRMAAFERMLRMTFHLAANVRILGIQLESAIDEWPTDYFCFMVFAISAVDACSRQWVPKEFVCCKASPLPALPTNHIQSFHFSFTRLRLGIRNCSKMIFIIDHQPVTATR